MVIYCTSKFQKKSLAEGLSLLTSDYDMLFLAGCHKRVPIVDLYIVSFENDGSVEEEDVVEDDNAAKACWNDPWWDDKISANEDVFNVDYRENGSGASKPKATNPNPQNDEGDVDPNMDANVDNEDNGSDDEDNGPKDESDDDDGVDVDDTNTGSGTNNEHFIRSLEDVKVDNNASDIARSDILVSMTPSDDDDDIPYHNGVDFHKMDLANPTLTLKMKFTSI